MQGRRKETVRQTTTGEHKDGLKRERGGGANVYMSNTKQIKLITIIC